MTNLQCTVKSCAHNESNCCCLNSIKVDGQNATASVETACKSFNKRGSFVSNFIPQGTPDKETYVACEATTCNYNRGKVCQAEHVQIDDMGTSDYGKSECASYEPAKY